jgi:hypothetical protein
MYVLTINQRDSREVGDRVDELVAQLADLPAVLPFQRSVGDEAIGAVAEARTAVDAAMRALRTRRWHVGIGVGPLDVPVPTDVAEAAGFGLVYARRAVDRARKAGERVPLAVAGPDADVAAEAEAVLRLIGQIVSTRTEAEWAVLDLMVPGVRGQQKAIAEVLGVTAQAVSKAVVRSHWNEEWACRPAAARLLDLVPGPPALPPASYAYAR